MSAADTAEAVFYRAVAAADAAHAAHGAALRAVYEAARAEGEAAGRAAERADVVAWLMRTEWADEEAYHIEAGRHVGAAGGAA